MRALVTQSWAWQLVTAKEYENVRFAELFIAPQSNIHEYYTQLRETEEGVHIDSEANSVAVMRYRDVDSVLRHKEVFSSETFWSSPISIHDPADPRQARFVEYIQNFAMFLDPPKHTRIRNIIRGALTPEAVKSMAAAISDVADEVLAPLESGQQIDFVKQLSEQIPIKVIAHIVGVPATDESLFRRGSLAMIDTIEPRILGEQRTAAILEANNLIEFLDDHIAQRRAASHRPNDLLTLLLDAEDEGDRLSADELIGMVLVLIGAGNTTTIDLLGNALALLTSHPEQYRDLASHPELVEQAIEEVVRVEPSLRWLVRKTVNGGATLGGQKISDGTLIWICLASANRDHRQFDEPDVFNIRRPVCRHLGFGSGIHYCLGAPLARLEARIVIGKFLQRFQTCELLSDGPLVYKPDFISRSLAELPLLLG